ncbi:hypothetical protein [Curtobacterium sp. MCBA15_004]|uniref:hypothetical protein n=1 Tax=Curtobacterium sp. MCBA15_004 TaxID=1898733 RepID=UPI0008DE17A7|nr:hypothetical protein [Curtobacterium sp. MCBA15_004]WIA96404.1 hypothetical protein QOL16_15100 [Curtobacterium sp. MCBA15_004]
MPFRSPQSDEQNLGLTLTAPVRAAIREFVASIVPTVIPIVQGSADRITALLGSYLLKTDATATYSPLGHKHAASDITAGGTTASGFTVGGDLEVSGGVTATGAVTGDAGTFPSALNSTGVYGRQLTSSYKAVYIDAGGNFGFSPSPRAVKTNIRPWQPDTDVLLRIVPSLYQYKAEFTERDRRAALPEDDPDHDDDYQVATMLGVIADDLDELGLEEFIFRDETGALAGVHYELLALALLPVIQAQEARLSTIEQHLGLPGKEQP